MEKEIKKIFLTGFMGTGKSAVGRALANRLKWRFVDLDSLIERKGRASVAEIFERKGERAFRAEERRQLLRTASSTKLVVALGGGALIDRRNVEFVGENGFLIKLTCSRSELTRRLKKNRASRPLLADGPLGVRLAALLRARRSAYGRPDLTISTSRLTLSRTVERILGNL